MEPQADVRPSEAGNTIKGVFQSRKAKVSSASQNYVFSTFISGARAADEVFLLEKLNAVSQMLVFLLYDSCV